MLWGCIVVGTGLVVLSQMAPVQRAANSVAPVAPKAGEVAAAKPAAAEGAKAAVPAAVPVLPPKVADTVVSKPAAPAPAVGAAPEVVVKPESNAVVDAGAAPAVQTPAAAEIPAAPAEKTAPVVTAVAPIPAAPVAVPPVLPAQDLGTGLTAAPLPAALPDLPAVPEAPPTLAGLEPALTAPKAEAAPVAPLPPEPEGAKDALLAPALQPGQAEPAHLPQIAPADDPSMVAVAPAAVPVPEVEVPPKASPATTIEAQVPTLPPVKGLTDRVPKGLGQVPGVEVNTLPHIGDTPKVEAPLQDERPVAKFARRFDGAAGKPLFVILLRDVGAAGMARAELAKLPFPVSFVVDPLASDAGAASKVYRAAGQEVVTLANGIPAGAAASDLAETFQTLSAILPESVAVIDQDLGGFQDDRPLAGMVLPILQDEGRGLVTYDRGLNAADQIARRDGVPSAVIFRRLDGAGEKKATIRRYLDRAAFKAAQEGAVVVIGDTRAETVAAILEWTVEGRASSVTLAPLTAVLGR